MANEVQGLIWRIPFPNPVAKIIALKCADNADDEGGSIYPSNSTIAHMCGASRGVVLKWLYAMEHCGLLPVVERSSGGNQKETTLRAFDMDLLHKLAWKNRRIPAKYELRVGTIDRPAQPKNKGQADLGLAPKLVRVTVLKIVKRGAPVHQEDGSARSNPSTKRTGDPSTTRTGKIAGPVHHVDGTRPPRGHESVSQPFEDGNPKTALSAPGSADDLIPFDEVTDADQGEQLFGRDYAADAVAGGVDPMHTGEGIAAVLALGKREAAKSKINPVFLDMKRLPFTGRMLGRVRSMCVDVEALVLRYLEKTKGRRIPNPDGYLLAMAREVVAQRDGLDPVVVAAMTDTSNRKAAERAAREQAKNAAGREIVARTAAPKSDAVQLAAALERLAQQVRR